MKVVKNFYDKKTGEKLFYTRQERYATILGDWMERDKEADLYRYSKYLRLFNITPRTTKGKVIVDIGCGAWGGLLPFIKNAKRKIAVDDFIEQYMMGRLWDEEADYEYLMDNGKRIRLQNGIADIVFCLNVLDHCDSTGEPPRIAKEIHRILKPGGRAFIFVHLREEDKLNIMHLYSLDESDVDDFFSDFHPTRRKILPRDEIWDRNYKTFIGVFKK